MKKARCRPRYLKEEIRNTYLLAYFAKRSSGRIKQTLIKMIIWGEGVRNESQAFLSTFLHSFFFNF